MPHDYIEITTLLWQHCIYGILVPRWCPDLSIQLGKITWCGVKPTTTVCGPWSVTFPKMIKYFVQKRNTLNNERYRDLLINILSYDEVSAGRLICLS